MAIYLFNLGFSVSNAATGNFSSGGSGITASKVWFQYNGTTPPGLNNYQGVVPTVGPTSNWQLATAPSSFNSNQQGGGAGDYLFLRIFNSDGTPGNFLVRTSVIFGQGTTSPSTPNPLQSPFNNSAGNAMPVLDCDTTVFSPGGQPPWPAPVTDNNPITANSSWTYCLGQVNGPTNDYNFNVGASVYVTTGAGAGSIYAFGIDPKMHVVGMNRRREEEPAA